MKMLIVEDQKLPLEALELAVNGVMPGYFPGFSRSDYHVARCYNEARNHITENEYDIVILDNRLPYENQGDLENIDFDRFSDSLESIGYSLIPVIKIKNPQTLVIGTSSLSKNNLRDLPSPDFTMRKDYCDSDEDLESILRQIKTNERGNL